MKLLQLWFDSTEMLMSFYIGEIKKRKKHILSHTLPYLTYLRISEFILEFMHTKMIKNIFYLLSECLYLIINDTYDNIKNGAIVEHHNWKIVFSNCCCFFGLFKYFKYRTERIDIVLQICYAVYERSKLLLNF